MYAACVMGIFGMRLIHVNICVAESLNQVRFDGGVFKGTVFIKITVYSLVIFKQDRDMTLMVLDGYDSLRPMR